MGKKLGYTIKMTMYMLKINSRFQIFLVQNSNKFRKQKDIFFLKAITSKLKSEPSWHNSVVEH